MMKNSSKFLRGDRVNVSLEKELKPQKDSVNKSNDSRWLMKEIVEKNSEDIKMQKKNPSCMSDDIKTGFPIPKKLSWKPFVAQYEYSNKQLEKEFLLSEQINEENMQKISKMSLEEIKNEKEELMTSLNPKLVQKLMQKKGLDKDVDDYMNKKKKVHFPYPDQQDQNTSLSSCDEKEQKQPLVSNIHFPTPPPFGDLDPSSPDFFKHLHSKYFPDLPVDPSKLAWMTPPTKAEDMMEYHESMSEIAPESIRFDFNGDILSPRISRQIPVYIGLHHHADAPLAAGYSIPELVHLSRSTFSAQRCIAILMLGRILYKLSKNTYGSVVTNALKEV
ncbi:hypothetical protein PCK2_000374 [Pneumocystis canis]|nr:hypothetical protein PCK2_000374 [Pneumocystis canis]